MMKQLTGAQIVLECLKEQGVDTVFGYPGGAILNIYDELYKQKKDFTHILTSHEQGASHAADGYARSTGKVGVRSDPLSFRLYCIRMWLCQSEILQHPRTPKVPADILL